MFFGASDGPMTDEQLDGAPSAIVHLPMVLGADVPVYNLPGVTAELKFSGPILADLFLGTTASRVQHQVRVPVLLLRAR